MLKKIPANDAVTKAKLRKLNIAQVAGYLYSGIVLGYGLPKLNAYLTNRRMAKLAAEEAAKAPSVDDTADFFKEQTEMKSFIRA